MAHNKYWRKAYGRRNVYITRSQDGRIQNGGNNSFGSMADAGSYNDFFRTIYIFVPVRVIYRAGNRPENTRVDFESDTAIFKGRKEKCFFLLWQ